MTSHRRPNRRTVFAGMMGAIVWDLITWYFGLPTSSSHALIGGYAGAAVAKAGWSAIIYSGWWATAIRYGQASVHGDSRRAPGPGATYPAPRQRYTRSDVLARQGGARQFLGDLVPGLPH